ncbi:MAG: hypothetical protein COZ68_05640, partial [Deltaproteobacteria bacterium CG_4_8_14_3_um_filter_43_13]
MQKYIDRRSDYRWHAYHYNAGNHGLCRMILQPFFLIRVSGFFFVTPLLHKPGVNGKVKVYQFRELKSVPPTPMMVV